VSTVLPLPKAAPIILQRFRSATKYSCKPMSNRAKAAGPDSSILERRIHSPDAIGLEFRKEFLTLPHLSFSKRQRL
jgi:hypothetical protein